MSRNSWQNFDTRGKRQPGGSEDRAVPKRQARGRLIGARPPMPNRTRAFCR